MTEITTTPAERRGAAGSMRRSVVAGVLVLLAVTGIAAAGTSSAWPDDVLFSAPAQTVATSR